MNFFSAIKNFVIGTPKLVDDVFDKDTGLLAKTGGFINDLSYTEQEKSRDVAKLIAGVTEFVKTTLTESTVRSKTRREIAVLWIKVQLWLILFTAIAIPFNEEKAKQFYELATCNVMLTGTLSIIAFFFGAYVWGAHIKKKSG